MTVKEFHGGNDPYPVGAIIMWYGEPEEVPYGWAVCDGTDGTPDLLSRFIRGAGNAEDAGGTGGQAQYTLSVSQMASHSHTGDTSYDGEHSHQIDRSYGSNGSAGYGCTGPDGSSCTATSTSTSDHQHSASTDTTGNDDPVDNEPAHEELLVIQKQDL